jgi:hypothetical protein
VRKLPSSGDTPVSESVKIADQAEVVPEEGLSLPADEAQGRTPDLLQPATEERYNFRFSAGKEFTEKFSRLAEVLGVANPHNHIETILDQAIEAALDKKDPKRKLDRRRKREAKQKAARPAEEETKSEGQGRAAAETEPQRETQAKVPTPEVSRYTSSAVRERRFEQAGYQCEYISPEGSRCTCRTGLEIDHVLPFGVFGINEEENLRVLCRAHNRLAAEEFYGREFIQQKIQAAKRERESAASSPGQVQVPG